ncbi:ampD [Symbiodinium necroappetens]|uniref:N-acetylmuramoyl-L-alanine amidase n=1 Tax=Symbiodinium necroappetens TaxID=1628268 RepID=A0A812PZ76_9DINO|nr:ampD [Symbiodinium necroappetens]
MCHPRNDGGCRMPTENEYNRLVGLLANPATIASASLKYLLMQNLFVCSGLLLVHGCSEPSKQEQLRGQLRSLQREFRQSIRRGCSSPECGIFCADAFYNACRERLEGHWDNIRPYLGLETENVTIIALNRASGASISEECEEHLRLFKAALPQGKSSRVQLLEDAEASLGVLANTNVLIVVGHNRSADQLDLLVQKLLRAFSQPRPSLDLVVFGVCKSFCAGQLLADAGIPSICYEGEPQAEHTWAFDASFRDELLKGPDPSTLSSGSVLQSQIQSAFDRASADLLSDGQRPRLCMPSKIGRLRHWLRKYRYAATGLLAAFLLAMSVVNVWRIHIRPRVYSSEVLRPCRGAEPFSLEEITGVLSVALRWDLTCHDPRKSMLQDWIWGLWTPESMIRVDKYTSERVKPTYLLMSHTVVRVDEAVHSFFAKTGFGCHFIIMRDGNLVQQVKEEHKAFVIRGCFERNVSGNCTALEANAHTIGVAFEGNGCVQNFTSMQYNTLEYLITMLRQRGYNIPDENVLPITAADYVPGRHVAPGRYFDWPRVRQALPKMEFHGSWYGAPLHARKQWMQTVSSHFEAMGNAKADYR